MGKNNGKVNIFNRTVKNILSHYIPHKTVTRDDRNPPWINKNVSQLILEKNQVYKSFLQSNKFLQLLNQFQFLQMKLNSLSEESNERHYIRSSKVVRSSDQPKLLLINIFWIIKQLLAFHLYYTKIKISLISKRKAKCLIFFAYQYSILWKKIDLPATLSL